MQKILLFISFSISLYATNLSEILDSLKSSKKIEVLQEKSYSEISANEFSLAYEAPELNLVIAHAKEVNRDGTEYAVGISQNIESPFSYTSKNNAIKMSSMAIKQSLKHQIHIIKLEIASKYHSACVSKEIKNKAQLLFEDQNKILEKVKRSYEFGEIAKKEYLFYKLELAKLKQYLSSYERGYLEELASLQRDVDSLELDDLACSDLLKPERTIQLNDIQEHGELQELSYQQSSVNASYAVADSVFDKIGYSLEHSKELDVDRYIFGISLPLSFLSSKKEQAIAKYMHQNSSLLAKKESLTKEIQSASKSSLLKLETLYTQLILLQDEILPLSLELYDLSKSAHASGEGTLMESIDSARSYKENFLEMLELKKDYYYELFELYKTADLDLGEKYEKIN